MQPEGNEYGPLHDVTCTYFVSYTCTWMHCSKFWNSQVRQLMHGLFYFGARPNIASVCLHVLILKERYTWQFQNKAIMISDVATSGNINT